MPFQTCMLGTVTLPFYVQYLPHVSATCFCHNVCRLEHNRIILRRMKKEVEMVFHPSITELYVVSIIK